MRKYFPDFEAFEERAKTADVVPVYRQLLADRLTPVTAFELLGRDAHAFLLESVIGNEKIGRYSFIATTPTKIYQATQGNASLSDARGSREFHTDDPLGDLAKLLPPRRYARDPGLPAFTGGLVGYAGYDTVRYYEGEKLSHAPADDRHLPDLLFGLYAELIIFDHVDKTIKVVANAEVGSGVASGQWPAASEEKAAAPASSTGHSPLTTGHSSSAPASSTGHSPLTTGHSSSASSSSTGHSPLTTAHSSSASSSSTGHSPLTTGHSSSASSSSTGHSPLTTGHSSSASSSSTGHSPLTTGHSSSASSSSTGHSPLTTGHSSSASSSSTAHCPLPTAHYSSAYRDACRRIDSLVARLSAPPMMALGEIDARAQLTLKYDSNFTRAGFEAAIRAGKEYIKAGDIFQFVPSQRLRVPSHADPFDVYRALRIINPSPFMFYLKSPGCTLIGASPEILCRVMDGKVESRPLAGTRKRGATEEEDKRLEAELLADPKERAEHIMLVDLHRNDVGRVAKIGSVVVSDMMTVERYSHVMHITTHVSGQLADGLNALDALRVSLPVGTVSGAPKIRAMQIIDELEPTRRGPYGGAVGYLDFAGNMDMCIALRTIVWRNGTFDVQAGAGVVADSDPASEYEETLNKARALLKAVEIAQAGF